MNTCDKCGRAFNILYEMRAWDDQDEERYLYSQVMEEQFLRQMFPGRELVLHVCRDCYFHLTGQRLPYRSRATPYQSFTIRTLQSAIAVAVARSLFEFCGYQVRYSGYEHTMPEWAGQMKQGDPNTPVARVRAMPDLRVYDRSLNNLYEIEVKSTHQSPSTWNYRKDLLDTLLYHYPDSLLMIYSQATGEFFVRRTKDIPWGDVPVHVNHSADFYSFNLLKMFSPPQEMFGLITAEQYASYRKYTGHVLKAFS